MKGLKYSSIINKHFDDIPDIGLAEEVHRMNAFNTIKISQANRTKTAFLPARCSNHPGKVELKKVEISISATWVDGLSLPYANNEGHQDGIFYTCYNNKGDLSERTLPILNKVYSFEQIIFVDDQIHNVKSVHQKLQAIFSQPSWSLHYKRSLYPVTRLPVQ